MVDLSTQKAIGDTTVQRIVAAGTTTAQRSSSSIEFACLAFRSQCPRWRKHRQKNLPNASTTFGTSSGRARTRAIPTTRMIVPTLPLLSLPIRSKWPQINTSERKQAPDELSGACGHEKSPGQAAQGLIGHTCGRSRGAYLPGWKEVNIGHCAW